MCLVLYRVPVFCQVVKSICFSSIWAKGGRRKTISMFCLSFSCLYRVIHLSESHHFFTFFLLSENNTLKSSICFKQKQFSSSKMQLFQFPFVVVISWYLLSCCKHMKKCAKNFLLLCSKQIFIFLEKLTKKQTSLKVNHNAG